MFTYVSLTTMMNFEFESINGLRFLKEISLYFNCYMTIKISKILILTI